MFNTIIALVVFAAVSLIGWGIAELKSKACGYEQNEDEKAYDDNLARQLHENSRTGTAPGTPDHALPA